MKNELLINGAFLAGQTKVATSQFRSCSALYIYTSALADADMKNVQVLLTYKGKRSAPIIDADLYALAQVADLISGAGYESAADSYIRIPLGKHYINEGEFLSLQIVSTPAIADSLFVLVDDVDVGDPLKVQSFKTIENYTSQTMMACYGFGSAGKSYTISGAEGYSILGSVGKLIANAQSFEVLAGIDCAFLYFDAKAEGQPITIRSSSASHILSIEKFTE